MEMRREFNSIKILKNITKRVSFIKSEIKPILREKESQLENNTSKDRCMMGQVQDVEDTNQILTEFQEKFKDRVLLKRTSGQQISLRKVDISKNKGNQLE